jgi:hypothetical protein
VATTTVPTGISSVVSFRAWSIALASQTSTHAWHASVLKWMHDSGSMTGLCGTACMNGMWIGVRGPSGSACRTSASSSSISMAPVGQT